MNVREIRNREMWRNKQHRYPYQYTIPMGLVSPKEIQAVIAGYLLYVPLPSRGIVRVGFTVAADVEYLKRMLKAAVDAMNAREEAKSTATPKGA
jgi:hypothetical protein